MADATELSRQSPGSLSPWEPSVLLQLWNPDVQGWSCLGQTQAGRRCRRALSQAKREAIMGILPTLEVSKLKDADPGTELFSQLNSECLCRDHDDADTAETLAGQWKTAFQHACSQYSADSRRLVRGLSTPETTLSPGTGSRPTPVSDDAGKRVDASTQLQSPPISSKESAGRLSPSPFDFRQGTSILKEEHALAEDAEGSRSTRSKTAQASGSIKSVPGTATETTPSPSSSISSSVGSAKEDVPDLDFAKPFPGLSPSLPKEKMPSKFGFSASVSENKPTKSPETINPTPSFDFTRLFKTLSSQKPTVNPQTSIPSPSALSLASKRRQPNTPETSSIADRSCSSAPSLSPSENSPSFVFSSSSTPAKPPSNEAEELAGIEKRFKDRQRQSLESQTRGLKHSKENMDEKMRRLAMHGESNDEVHEKKLGETEKEIKGLGDSIESLQFQLRQSGTPIPTTPGPHDDLEAKGEPPLLDSGSHHGSEKPDEPSERGKKGKKQEGENVGSV